jgi:serine/threonine protein phosphatase 1
MIAIIGDIHGCYFTLVELVEQIKSKFGNIKLYCVGDLVDRGRNSFEVVDFIKTNNIQFSPGNHDYMFYDFFKNPTSVFAKTWMFNGNESTMESYMGREEDVFKHIDFLHDRPLFLDLEDCFISHAGISQYYEKQLIQKNGIDFEIMEKVIKKDFYNDRGILWNRDNLLNIGKLQVHGHTKQRDIMFDEDSFSVNIDTGACYGNKMSAVIISENKIIDSLEEKTHIEDLI